MSVFSFNDPYHFCPAFLLLFHWIEKFSLCGRALEHFGTNYIYEWTYCIQVNILYVWGGTETNKDRSLKMNFMFQWGLCTASLLP